MPRFALAFVLVALLATGCAAPAATTPPASPSPGAEAAPLFRLTSDSCDEGGGYVTWNTVEDNQAPPPFEIADVHDDLGNPPINNNGNPIPDDNVTGAYHTTIHCAKYTLDGVEKENLLIALVGGRVHSPHFDPAPVERNYALSTLGTNDPDLVEALARVGIQTERLLGASLSFDADVLLSTMDFEHHGGIINLVPVKDYREKPSETIRIWLLMPEGEDSTRPVAIDFQDTGGRHWVASAMGRFDHRTPSPAPPAPGIPIHEFNSWALAYRGVERTIVPGPALDVVIDGSGHAH